MKRILTVGITYTGPKIEGVEIESLGLCRAEICDEKAAYSLYEYDAIIINPCSYSHFIFGTTTKHSESDNELFSLKKENNDYDLDTIFDKEDRRLELDAAIKNGTVVVWCMAEPKPTHFFGLRTINIGYANSKVSKILDASALHKKKSRALKTMPGCEPFKAYFEAIAAAGWRLCLSEYPATYTNIVDTPEGYSLGGSIEFDTALGWLLTPPTSEEAANALVNCCAKIKKSDTKLEKYHSIFLSHTHDDKPFVRELQNQLNAHGVEEIWIDEAEIQVGDSLMKKIEEGMKTSKYVAVILSKNSVKAPWVQKELEIAMNTEITKGQVVVLPILYEECELPVFLSGKLYADFTNADRSEESLRKLLNRLRIS